MQISPRSFEGILPNTYTEVNHTASSYKIIRARSINGTYPVMFAWLYNFKFKELLL